MLIFIQLNNNLFYTAPPPQPHFQWHQAGRANILLIKQNMQYEGIKLNNFILYDL